MKFKITYKDGLEVVRDQSDCDTPEQLINCMFGSGHNLEELGITVELMEEEIAPTVDSEVQSKKIEEAPPKVDNKPHVVKVAKPSKDK